MKSHLFRTLLLTSLCFGLTVSFAANKSRQQGLARPTTTLFAKKKKNGKKKGKKGGFEWATSFKQQPFEASQKRDLVGAALASFKGRAGKPLSPELDSATDVPKALWDSRMACVIVTKEGVDSVVEYANIAALETIGLKPADFEQLFLTKPKELQTASESVGVTIQLDLPSEMKGEKQFESGYKKKMLRQESGDITIIDAYRWSIKKSTIVGGKFVTETIGVGYSWEEWLIGESLLCSSGGVQGEVLDLTDLKERISNQGALVRDLKETQGFGNKDRQVVKAVAELIRLKNLDEN